MLRRSEDTGHRRAARGGHNISGAVILSFFYQEKTKNKKSQHGLEIKHYY